MWFPARERGMASSIYVCGQYLGTALFTGALLWLATTYDWRHVFYSTGLVGIVFGVVWLFLYRDPLNCKKVSKEELAYIENGGGLVKSSQQRTVSTGARSPSCSATARCGRSAWASSPAPRHSISS